MTTMLKFAVSNLFSRPLRSTLSILGLAVAIAGMVGLFSIAGGIDRVVSNTFQQIPGLLVQQQGAPIPLFSTLPAEWRAELEAIPGVGVVDPEVFCRLNQLDGKIVINPPRFAAGMDIASRLALKRSIYRENIVAGRYLSEQDLGVQRCVVSREISTSINKGVADEIDINGASFEIVGIYDTGSMMLDVNILMDIGVCRALGRIDLNTVGCFYVESDGTVSNSELQKSIEDHFRGRDLSSWKRSDFQGTGMLGANGENPLAGLIRGLNRNFAPQKSPVNVEKTSTSESEEVPASNSGKPDTADDRLPIEVRSADDWGKRIGEFSKDLNIFLFLMTTIGVSIATLSIVNTMMMSVTERTTEFGILRANGWSRGEIVRLMILESGLIGLGGGLLGTGVGWMSTLAINWNWPGRLQLHASAGLIAASLVFSLILGLLGGTYPAWRASRLSPMESIRRG